MAAAGRKRAHVHGKAAAVVLVGLGLAVAAVAASAEPGLEPSGLGSRALFVAWVAVFAALYALSAHERAGRSGITPRARAPVPVRQAPRTLFAVKPARAAPEPASPAPRRPRAQKAAPALQPADAVARCAELRAAGRCSDAARLAREGLASARQTGALLLELSRAEWGLGHAEAAIDVARDAHFASRSRASAEHLIRLLALAGRFERGDGPSLRRAARRHPREVVLLAAAGVYEARFGKRCDAEALLRAALTLGPDGELDAAIRRALAGVAECAGSGAPERT